MAIGCKLFGHKYNQTYYEIGLTEYYCSRCNKRFSEKEAFKLRVVKVWNSKMPTNLISRK